MIENRTDFEYALALDAKDPLKKYRDFFHIPSLKNAEPQIYFCGNSLGLQPKSAQGYVEQELRDWAQLGVEGHFHGHRPWLSYHHDFKESLAHLVGAKNNEVVAMNSLTTNLHILMTTFYRPTKNKFKIVIFQNAFPSDHYAVTSQVKLHGYAPEQAIVYVGGKSPDQVMDMQELWDVFDGHGDQIAMVLIEGVSYITGQWFDLKTIKQKASGFDICVGVDLAHAIGNVPLSLHEDGVDFAVWCSYKYLNGGPGCVGGAYVHEHHVSKKELPQQAGWWGHDEATRFQMDKTFVPILSADRFQMSNAPVMNMVCLRASLEIFDQVGMESLRAKSLQMVAYMQMLLKQKIDEKITQVTPLDLSQRGSQFSLIVPGGKKVFDNLQSKGILCDWREPNILRLAPVPLYNQYQEIWKFADALMEALR